MTEQEREEIRSDVIEEKVKRYELELSAMRPEELFGQESLEQMMEEHISFLLEDYEEALNSLSNVDLGIEDDDYLEDKMDAIEDEEGFLLARLEQRNGGQLPGDSIPELIERAARKFGWKDPDVQQLAQLEVEYNALMDRFIGNQLEDAADDEGGVQ